MTFDPSFSLRVRFGLSRDESKAVMKSWETKAQVSILGGRQL